MGCCWGKTSPSRQRFPLAGAARARASDPLPKRPEHRIQDSAEASGRAVARLAGRLELLERTCRDTACRCVEPVESGQMLGFGVAFLGSVSQYLGMLAATMERWDEASRHFDHTIEQNLRVGALPWVAHARYEYARALSLRTGSSHRNRARKEVTETVRIAQRLGMKNIEAKASARSRRGATPLETHTSYFRLCFFIR